MSSHPEKLPGFVFRKPDDDSDDKLLSDIRDHGWHVLGIPDDDEGPGFCYTVGVHLRTLQPEILIMGLPIEVAHGLLNDIAEHAMAGGVLAPGTRYSGFIDGLDLIFRPIHESHYREYLGYANWFYRSENASYPALQCFWPDKSGLFPGELGFDARYASRQIDLSIPAD